MLSFLCGVFVNRIPHRGDDILLVYGVRCSGADPGFSKRGGRGHNTGASFVGGLGACSSKNVSKTSISFFRHISYSFNANFLLAALFL